MRNCYEQLVCVLLFCVIDFLSFTRDSTGSFENSEEYRVTIEKTIIDHFSSSNDAPTTIHNYIHKKVNRQLVIFLNSIFFLYKT